MSMASTMRFTYILSLSAVFLDLTLLADIAKLLNYVFLSYSFYEALLQILCSTIMLNIHMILQPIHFSVLI